MIQGAGCRAQDAIGDRIQLNHEGAMGTTLERESRTQRVVKP
jgi:hypothetical protein